LKHVEPPKIPILDISDAILFPSADQSNPLAVSESPVKDIVASMKDAFETGKKRVSIRS
jgi:hypothetical protein